LHSCSPNTYTSAWSRGIHRDRTLEKLEGEEEDEEEGGGGGRGGGGNRGERMRGEGKDREEDREEEMAEKRWEDGEGWWKVGSGG
jgi:hypothetical protein